MITRIYRPTPHNLKLLANRLKHGRLVALPTETVYGLAADALNVKACKAIFTAKDRPSNDPLIVHVRTKAEAKKLTVWNDVAEKLAHKFWPGPLTLVLPKRGIVPEIVTSGMPSVAVRIPAHPIFRQILELCGRPLAAPSANPFSYISPTTAQHVKDSLDGRIEAIIDGGACQVGLESTIVDLRYPEKPQILRPGGTLESDLTACIGSLRSKPRFKPPTQITALAPGQQSKHYSPKTPLFLHHTLPEPLNDEVAHVHFAKDEKCAGRNRFYLTESGDGAQAARELFKLLRNLDQGSWKEIHLELPPPESAWYSGLYDRMLRASTR